ncbi:uncharacterized protein BP5553_07129 [Venustampulla echinocandica]|uniref:Carboxymuconolactone decarboxylase-like domain-containing protein n=1 Tax=Venustampulla echinocandica TaxID=2656787 RepID=A0A370TIL5_9HELO|nr:uncharacterized protein BP5553_07129 [Venustampulla echinocandica]RDL35198.1 hypothetical protein BP5553_07129 [Venustampulla echinocandica]
MPRFAPIPPESLTPDQRAIHDHIDSVYNTASGSSPPFTMKDHTGALLGPFPMMIHAPFFGTAWFDHIMTVSSHPALEPRARELAILAVGAHYHCPYELYAHKRVALLPALGMSQTQVTDASEGKVPDGLSPAEQVAYEFAMEMLNSKGPVAKPHYDHAVALLGKESVLILMQLVGVYSFVCLMLNGAATEVPE